MTADERLADVKKLIEQARQALRPGNRVSDVQEPALRAMLDLIEIQGAAVEALIAATVRLEEQTAFPSRVVFMADSHTPDDYKWRNE